MKIKSILEEVIPKPIVELSLILLGVPLSIFQSMTHSVGTSKSGHVLRHHHTLPKVKE